MWQNIGNVQEEWISVVMMVMMKVQFIRCIHGIIHLIEDHAKRAKIPARFAATKLVESDRNYT